MKKIAIGIDFSKKTFDATIMRRVDNDSIEIGYGKFDNDEKGFKTFIAWVRKTVRHLPEGKDSSTWIFCGENTGVCSAALSDFLAVNGYDMWLESALQIKQSSGILRTKTDKADSRRIAGYALRNFSGKARLHEPDSREYKKLDSLFALHNMLTRDKVAKKNQIKSGTLDASPEALRIATEQLEAIEEHLNEVDRLMEGLMRKSEEFKENYAIIVSVKGVGPFTACCIILKTHNLKYMDDPRVFGNFAGVVPSQVEQSGTSVNKQRKVSRTRDKETNAALSMAVNSALTWNPIIREYFDRLVARGVHVNKARNNCKFKLVNIIMAMLRTRTKFDVDRYGKAKGKWPQTV